jgi:tetratricopeptide (TPR) repeat protein
MLAATLGAEARKFVGLDNQEQLVEAIELRVFGAEDCYLELQKLLDILSLSLPSESFLVRDTMERLLQRWNSWLSDFHKLLEPIHERLIALRIQEIGANHSEIADRLMFYAEYLSNIGRNVEAQNCLTRAISIRKRFANDNPCARLSYIQALARLGCLLAMQRYFDLSVIHLELAAEMLKDARSRLKVHAFEDLGLTYIELGRHSEAENILKQAISVNDASAVDSVAGCAIKLGSIYLLWGNISDAFSMFDFSLNFDRDSTWHLPELNGKKTLSDELTETSNPLLELVDLMESRYSASDTRRFCRDLIVRKYSWAIPSNAALTAIINCGPIVEVGAGTGYWAALLRRRGADIIAYDALPAETKRNGYTSRNVSWTEVLLGSESTVAFHPDRTLMLCWPPNRDVMATKALEFYTGDRLIYIGEEWPGCTADFNFHQKLQQNWTLETRVNLPRWSLITDSVFIYARNKTAPPAQTTLNDATKNGGT